MIAKWVGINQAVVLVGRSQRTLQLWAAAGLIDRKYDADGRVLYGRESLLKARRVQGEGRFVSRRPGPGRHRSFQSERLWDE